ncbi:hypothetical protein K8I28_05470 [bacterium]|nr:hypothetical protein [bacterium]
MKSLAKILLTLLIVISLLVGFLYLKNERVVRNQVELAQNTIGAIYIAAKMHCGSDRSYEWPPEIEDLIKAGYLDIDTITAENWLFEITGQESITATSTENNPIGKGKIVTYDIIHGVFIGYGLPSLEEQLNAKKVQKNN